MKRKSSRTSIIITTGALLAALIAVSFIPKPSYQAIKSTIAPIAMETVKDGDYEGYYFLLPVKVRVLVRVSGGAIRSIELLQHFNGQGKSAEAIIADVIAKQSLAVDAITGATHSSVTILKAIENALQKGSKR